jgi:glycosyltransferase involved in cell wall biosynthesis
MSEMREERAMNRNPRVLLLWARLSGYLRAELKALEARGVDMLLVHEAEAAGAPFEAETVRGGLRAHTWHGSPDLEEIRALVDEFEPDVALICSWDNGVYRRIGRELQGKALRILTMDNQWLGTVKQRAGVAASRFIVRPAYDAALVAGERQAAFATKLGFPLERIVWGLYTADHDCYAEVARRRGDGLPPAAFVFVGRLVPEKAVDVLAEAYRRYRASVTDPWPLLVAGIGPESSRLEPLEGVKMLGFVQPPDLPAVLGEAGCLVIPSRYEPWAVVIHEATSAGLPVVCSHACGSSTRLVLDGYNGVVTTTGDVDAFAAGLRRVHRWSDERRRAAGKASSRLALQYTPDRWAENLLDRIPDLREQVGLQAAPWAGEA